MSNFAITWALSQKTGSPTSKLVLFKLADQANDDGLCWPSQKIMADQCEVNRSTINRNIKKLADLGLVEIIPRTKGGVSLPNIYRLQLLQQGVSPEIGVGAQEHRGGRTGAQGVGAQEHTNPQLEPSLNPQDKNNDSLANAGALGDEQLSVAASRKTRSSAQDLPAGVDEKLWADFVAHRKALKKPMTDEAGKRLVMKLERMAAIGHDPAEALENSIVNGWQGVFEPDEKRSKGHGPSNSGRNDQRPQSATERFWARREGRVFENG